MDVFSDPTNQDVYLTGFWLILKLTGASAVIGSLVLGVAAGRDAGLPDPGAARLRHRLGQHLPQHAADAGHLLLLLRALCANARRRRSPTTSTLNNFWLGVIGLSVYTAAFVCEAIRSGINTVPAGQAEAARAIGLTFAQTLRLIVLPQAGRAVIAPLGSVLIALTKNTTIVGTIGVAEAAERDEGADQRQRRRGHRRSSWSSRGTLRGADPCPIGLRSSAGSATRLAVKR